MYFMPWSLRKPYVQWINRKLGGYVPEENPDLPARVTQTVRLAQELKKRTGEWPALLILTSHPDTEGPFQWLRFELLRQGLQIADAVVEARRPGAWFPAHPKCLLAIDPYALDTVSAPVGGFYGAWMHRIYLAWDRQPRTQSWVQKNILLRRSDYSGIGWKLLRCLKADVPVLMVLSGGLPFNARLLYASKEFVHRLALRQWNMSKREAQKELMEILMKPEGDVWPADRGDISPARLGIIRAALGRWGVSPEQIEPAIQALREEFRLSVPYRERLFRVLHGRITDKGKPLILVGINHSESAPHVQVSEPLEISAHSDPSALARAFARFFVSL